MSWEKRVVGGIFAAVLATGIISAANAATVNDLVGFNDGVTTGSNPKTYTEDGFQFFDSRIVGGQCAEPASDKCEALNKHQSIVLTRVDGAAFDLTAIWFYLDGKAQDMTNSLVIYDTNMASHKTTLSQANYTHNTAYTAVLDFIGVKSITFASGGDIYMDCDQPKKDKPPACKEAKDQGNARFDFVPTGVPIPASGLMLVGAIGGLAALRRRKSV